MKRELDKSKASFKLDLLETANADPMIRPADFKVLAAYIAMMKWPSCKSWLSTTLAMTMTGLSDRQFEKSRARLLGGNDEKRKYLIPILQVGKVAAYMLINPWRDEARLHMEAKLAYLREAARQKKAAQRASMSPKILRGQKGGCPRTLFGPVPELCSDNTPLMITPRKKERHGEVEQASEVVCLEEHRRRKA